MKRLIALLLVFAMVFAFAGCETTETDENGKEETTESSGEATQEQTEPEKQTEQVSLSEALSNTSEAMEAGNMTISMQGSAEMTEEQLPGLVSGMNIPLNGDIQLVVDPETEEISAYGVMNVSGMVMTFILHDGWMVTYDSDVEAYYKENVEGLFAQDESGESEVTLDQIPEEYLEQLEEVMDPDKLLELAETLATEKFSDEQWLKDTFGYTSATEGDVTVHTFELDLVVFMEAVISHFEEAFQDEDVYQELMDSLEEADEFMPEFTLKLSLTQTGDTVTGAGVYLEFVDPDTEQPAKVDITLSFTEIGTTQIDTEMLESIIDELMEYDEFFEEYYGDESAEQDVYQGGSLADFL